MMMASTAYRHKVMHGRFVASIRAVSKAFVGPVKAQDPTSVNLV